MTALLEEPGTAVTDWVMAALAAWWAVALVSAAAGRAGGAGAAGAAGAAGDGAAATFLWGAAFAATAVSAALGGLVHGFQHRMGPARAQPLWRATLHLVTLASAAMLAAPLLVFPASGWRAAALGLVALKLLAATGLLVRAAEFRIALLDHVITLLAVVLLQAAAWQLYGAGSAPWIIAGIAVAAVAGAVQALRIAPHPAFDHNALYHVIQIGALWLLFRGGLLLGVA